MANLLACRKAFTDALLKCARADSSIVAVTSDARGSVTLDKFAAELPHQFIEVGIAEQNLIGIASGLALSGKKPFACSPACFVSARSMEQVKLDIAYNNSNVKVIGVSGGVSYGPLGASHHSLNDIAVMRTMPGLTVILPCDARETSKMVKSLAEWNGPTYVRMGRNPVPDVYEDDDMPFEIGKANTLLDGDDITIIATGEVVRQALNAGIMLRDKGIHARVIDMHTIKPLDEDAILKAAQETGNIITVEEHYAYGGLGSAVAEFTAQRCPIPVSIMGFPDEYAATGEQDQVLNYYGLTADGICNTALKMLEQ
jgi:transketolase